MMSFGLLSITDPFVYQDNQYGARFPESYAIQNIEICEFAIYLKGP